MILSNGRIISANGRILESLSVTPVIPVVGRKAQINLDSQNRGVIPMWNNWYGNNASLNTPEGQSTGWMLNYVSGFSGDSGAEDQGSQTDPDGQYPSSVLQWMIYSTQGFSLQYTGLNPTKTYKLSFAAIQYYNYEGNITNIILNGVTYNLNGPNRQNEIYKLSANVVNPSNGQINVTFSVTDAYACMNAMIIEEL